MVKIQFRKIIKKWRINGGKEYSLKKLAGLANNLGQVIKLTILYNLEQDSTSERAIGILYEHT